MLAYRAVVTVLLQFWLCDGISGDFIVTFAVFSGREDPEWTVVSSNPNYNQIQTRVAAAIERGDAFLPDDLPARLGYKGILVQPVMQKKGIVGQATVQKRLFVGPKTVQLQLLLFQTMPKSLIKIFPENVRKRISEIIGNGTVTAERNPKTTKRAAPRYRIAPWTSENTRRLNNCYNYANNRITDTFAQPGRGSGNIFLNNGFTANSVLNAAVNDGLQLYPAILPGAPAPGIPAGPRHLVALVFWPGVDYHWYRLDDDGTWSHKPGQTKITKKDYGGNAIVDPRYAAQFLYQFVSFMTTINDNTVTIN